MSLTQKSYQRNNQRLLSKLSLTAVGMFAFGFLLVPLYDVFCEVTGLNGKTGSKTQYVAEEVTIDESREITVQFSTRNNVSMSWEFKPGLRQIKVNPGALNEVAFYAKNSEKRKMIAQAIPSVSPSEAAAYLHKTECFCFNQQSLDPGEEIYMPLMFYLDTDLPRHITKLTLSYTLFDVTDNFINSRTAVSAN
jgi:cytochrome c oxidase assembly protein subunit 11